jgi:hypothetical protein
MFGAETPFLLIGAAIVIGALGGGGLVLKAMRLRGRKNEDAKA